MPITYMDGRPLDMTDQKVAKVAPYVVIVLTKTRLANIETQVFLQRFILLQRPLFLLLKKETPDLIIEFKRTFPMAIIKDVAYFTGEHDFNQAFDGLKQKIKTYMGQFYGYGS